VRLFDYLAASLGDAPFDIGNEDIRPLDFREDALGELRALLSGGGSSLRSLDRSNHIARLDLSEPLQSSSGPPKRSREEHQTQGSKGDDSIAVLNEKNARANFIPAEHDEEIGDTFFRGLLGFVALYFAYALLKRFGTSNDPNTDGDNKNGENPPNSCQ